MELEQSEFERVAEALGLSPPEYLTSSALREWARLNMEYKYVPSELLKAWGFLEE
jgi:hypothetical protein